jgi:hypothetical protein
MSSSSKRSSRSSKSTPPTPESPQPPVSEVEIPVSEPAPMATEVEEATPPAPSSLEVASESDSQDTPADSPTISRLMPIPPPSEPRQYRAIGLVRGQYAPSIDQITRGALMASSDGTPINAVLLGRVMSLVKNHIDLQQTHLWVVYPRTGQHDGNLHVQIVGVWEPETLNEANDTSDDPNGEGANSTAKASPASVTEVEDNYFSVRGEAIFADREQGYLVIKIRQAPRKAGDKMKFFKLKLTGTLPGKAVGHFWEFHVCRQGNDLIIQESHDMGALPIRKPFKGGPRRFDRNKKPGYSQGSASRYPSRNDSGERRPLPSKPIPRNKEGSSPTSAPKKILPPDRSSS